MIRLASLPPLQFTIGSENATIGTPPTLDTITCPARTGAVRIGSTAPRHTSCRLSECPLWFTPEPSPSEFAATQLIARSPTRVVVCRSDVYPALLPPCFPASAAPDPRTSGRPLDDHWFAAPPRTRGNTGHVGEALLRTLSEIPVSSYRVKAKLQFAGGHECPVQRYRAGDARFQKCCNISFRMYRKTETGGS